MQSCSRHRASNKASEPRSGELLGLALLRCPGDRDLAARPALAEQLRSRRTFGKIESLGMSDFGALEVVVRRGS